MVRKYITQIMSIVIIFEVSSVHSDAVVAVINRIYKRGFDKFHVDKGGQFPTFFIVSRDRVYEVVVSELNLCIVVRVRKRDSWRRIVRE